MDAIQPELNIQTEVDFIKFIDVWKDYMKHKQEIENLFGQKLQAELKMAMRQKKI